MHLKNSTINFLKSNEIISKVPWKSDIFHYGLIFQFDNIISPVLVNSVSACNAVVGNNPYEPIIIENNSIYILK